ncbi:hypothetical protein QYE76_018982 [Lolium multiflorum]|uniref:Uncharacterized protein n=1 Tax=Lolium multiflorum TaxID=4521 RepID=A0AAD8Q322_LOLMU|nr:hypothetical protein QYE76_018982 [Lolium multiflorum]
MRYFSSIKSSETSVTVTCFTLKREIFPDFLCMNVMHTSVSSFFVTPNYGILQRDPVLSADAVAALIRLLCFLLRLPVVARGEAAEGQAGAELVDACLQGAMELPVLSSFVRNTRRSSSTTRSLAGMAARLQPPRRRTFSASFAGAQCFFADKWFVFGGGEVASGCKAMPEACCWALRHRISTETS